MSKPLPDEHVPWWLRTLWCIEVWVSWPWQVRQMKRAGFRRTGWMTWETGPGTPGKGWPDMADTWT